MIQDNMSSLQYDEELILSNVFMQKQVNGDNLEELASNRKRMPRTALGVWKHNWMRQNNIFSRPLVHGMCTELQNICKLEFSGMQDQNQGQDGVLDEQMYGELIDLNSSPADVGLLDLNFSPADVGLLDLNISPAHDEQMQDQHRAQDGVPDPNSSLTLKVIKSRDGEFTTADKEITLWRTFLILL